MSHAHAATVAASMLALLALGGPADLSAEPSANPEPAASAGGDPPATPAASAGASAEAPEPRGRALAAVRNAECRRAAECGHIGPGQVYSSMRGCRASVGKREAGELSAGACPRGADPAAVSECVADLTRVACESLGGAASLPSCKPDRICR